MRHPVYWYFSCAFIFRAFSALLKYLICRNLTKMLWTTLIRLWNGANLSMSHILLPGDTRPYNITSQKCSRWIIHFSVLKALFSSEVGAKKKKVIESVKKIREIGRQRIENRIDDMNQGKKVPEDVLTYIIKASQEVSGDDAEKMNVMMDEFTLFFFAGKFPNVYRPFVTYPIESGHCLRYLNTSQRARSWICRFGSWVESPVCWYKGNALWDMHNIENVLPLIFVLCFLK